MDSERFRLVQGSFDILDFKAQLDFFSQSSVGFHLGRSETTTIRGVVLGPNFHVFGSLDVHYPCADHIKVRMRACLPQQHYQSQEQRLQIISAVFKALGIAEDETYELHFLHPSAQVAMTQPRDREGNTDGFYD